VLCLVKLSSTLNLSARGKTLGISVFPERWAVSFSKLERVIGFEPMINGFADRRLWPLGYTRKLVHAERFELPYPFSKTEAFAG
jgi:hypothetical protein